MCVLYDISIGVYKKYQVQSVNWHIIIEKFISSLSSDIYNYVLYVYRPLPVFNHKCSTISGNLINVVSKFCRHFWW